MYIFCRSFYFLHDFVGELRFDRLEMVTFGAVIRLIVDKSSAYVFAYMLYSTVYPPVKNCH